MPACERGEMNDAREVIRCPKCNLNQFKTVSERCRRCRFSLAPAPLVPTPDPAAQTDPLHTISTTLPSAPLGSRLTIETAIAAVIIYLRTAKGLSQRDMAQRMRVARTYISKIENGKATPTCASLVRIAAALGITTQRLVFMADLAGRNAREFDAWSSQSVVAPIPPPPQSRAAFA